MTLCAPTRPTAECAGLCMRYCCRSRERQVTQVIDASSLRWRGVCPMLVQRPLAKR